MDPTCEYEGCLKPKLARGWCAMHYQRWRKHGDPKKTERPAYVQAEPTGSCLHCGKPAPRRSTRGSAPSYCSTECINRAYYVRNAERLLTERRAKRKLSRKDAPKTCPNCGMKFAPEATLKQRFCSKRCSQAATRDSRTRVCSEADCGRPVRAKGLCNMHYKRALRAEGRMNDKNWTPRKRAAWEARNALIRGAEESSTFDRVDIFERDGWVCGICLDAVDRDLAYPHPMSASLDHVTPVSLGGSHSPENVQCSHLTCNVRKGNRMGAA